VFDAVNTAGVWRTTADIDMIILPWGESLSNGGSTRTGILVDSRIVATESCFRV
jgi:hypothetical protein